MLEPPSKPMQISVGEFLVEVLFPVHETLLCVICSHILLDPHQSPCGCRFCYSCIRDYLNEDRRVCPGMTEDCRGGALDLYADIKTDILARREICKLVVRCCFESCDKEAPIRTMREHIAECACSSVTCAMCQQSVTRGGYVVHLATECREGMATCEGCGQTMRRARLQEEHQNYTHDLLCPLYANYCPNACLERGKVLWIEHRGKCTVKCTSCPFQTIGCPSGGLSAPRMAEHLAENVYEHSEGLLKHIDNLTNEIALLNLSLSSVAANLRALERGWAVEAEEQRKRQTRDLVILKRDMQRHVQNQVKVTTFMSMRDREASQTRERHRLSEELRRTALEVDELKARSRVPTTSQERLLSRVEDVVLVWRLCGLSKTSRHVSEPFFTHMQGYKLLLTVEKAGGFLSVYARLLCGEHDDRLSWPFRGAVSVAIMDQDGLKRDYRRTILFDEAAGRVCNRKIATTEGDFGFSRFILLQALTDRSYLLRADELMLQCTFHGLPP